MTDQTPFISVGYHKGEMDFSVGAGLEKLTLEEYSKLREMTIVAIGIMENMWRNSHQPECGQSSK